MQEIATAKNLPITTEELDVIKGWLGKPKGIKQLLWEQGLLDPKVQYIAKLKKDDPNDAGKVEYSTLLANCTDFLSEKTCLMYLRERLQVDVDQSTKGHHKLAGEGVEGHAKGLYQKANDRKNGRKTSTHWSRDAYQLRQVGKGCLTTTMIRKFSR